MSNAPQPRSIPALPQKAMVNAAAPTAVEASERRRRLQNLVTQHLDRTARIIRVLGAPVGELEDLVQQAFSITASRLPDIERGKESAFLVETAVRLAANARRVQARGREIPTASFVEMADTRPSAEDLSDQRRAMEVLDRVLHEMDEDLTTVFVLCEVEQMTMADVAALLRVPAGTIASRLRRAREDFATRLRRFGLGEVAATGRKGTPR
jgi:RNA polymerase sigma-70 factor (ECF subfamily)